MSKFAATARTALPLAPTRTIRGAQTRTHQGGVGFVKDARTELFSLGVANFVAEDTFYERGATRDQRFVDLVHEVAALDPAWVAGFIPWLRKEANMRTASIVAAIEYARARPGFDGRQVIARTLDRADEPAEALAYFMANYGRKIPMAVKRGIADAAVRLYTQNAALKYDPPGANMRMGDVIDITHPNPNDVAQYVDLGDPRALPDLDKLSRAIESKTALFKFLLDKRHNRDNPRGLDQLGKIASVRAANKAAADGEELEVVDGMTWEQVISAKGAAGWAEVIPRMGYMALIRNLRNIEQAGLDENVLLQIGSKLADPAEVAKSRQLPFRFLSAWEHSGTMRFAHPLEMAVDHCLANIPAFPGKTLIMVDVSDSMAHPMSAKSKMSRKGAGALFGAAVLKRSAPGSKMGVYATGVLAVDKVASLLRTAEEIHQLRGVNGQGTNTWPSTQVMWHDYGPFDRILVFTDAQHHPSQVSAGIFPAHVPIYVWDLAGYRPSGLDVGSGRYLLGGLNDQTFKLIEVLESGHDGRWPWETAA